MRYWLGCIAVVSILAEPRAGAASAGPDCIRAFDIDHTDRPNDRTVVFTMKDHSVYRSDLKVRCPGLAASVDGFTFSPTDPNTGDLCDGLATFRLNDVGHATCIFGPFTRLK